VAATSSPAASSRRRRRDVAFLAWTTTPWTLAANTGLAVHPEADYALVEGPPRKRAGARRATKLFVLAEALVADVFGDAPHRVLGVLPARPRRRQLPPALRGRPDDADAPDLVGWRVVADDFVTLDDGTGIVHLAPAYGDLEVGRRHGCRPAGRSTSPAW
jgi:isoleucyl-tRNA synthetase